VQSKTNRNTHRKIVRTQTNLTKSLPLVIGLSSKLPVRSFFSKFKKIASTNQKTTLEFDSSTLLFDQIGCASDVGKVRQIDEDSVLVAKIFSTNMQTRQEKVLMIIADGMGGHNKGEIASAIGVATAANLIVPKLCSQTDLDFAKELSSALKEANTRILNYAMDHPDCEGMGTTMTASIINSQKIYTAHVGDTRAYLLGKGKTKQLTKDHSLVQDLVDKGEITPDEAKNHPQKNVITRVVGYYPNIEVDNYESELQKDDQILMCCDGLVNHVSDSEIAEIVISETNPAKTCAQLISVANERGGKDNISVILTSKYRKS
jgi:PPM family protein phosphatase